MTTQTGLANYALSQIGEGVITDIDGTDRHSKACKLLVQPVIDEVLRSHRWNCSIARATLSRLASAPNHGLDYAYQLPADWLRLLEVNGEAWEGSDQFFEIENGSRLLTNESEAKVRYIKRIGVIEMDPLLREACALKLAVKLAISLAASAERQAQVGRLYDYTLRKAASVDAVETKGREGRPFDRILENSPLVRSRFLGRYSQTRFYNRFPTW